jgi:hypothetical protein
MGGEYGTFDASVPPPVTELEDAPAGVQDLFAQAEAGTITYEEAYETAEDDFEWTSEAHDETGEYGGVGLDDGGLAGGEYGGPGLGDGGEDEHDHDEDDEDADWDDEDEDVHDHDEDDDEGSPDDEDSETRFGV